ncbi:MAG: TolC family protein [Myxococcaceae bacterium]
MRSFALSVVVVLATAAQAGEVVSVEDAVQRALSRNAQVRAARERVAAAEDGSRSVRGQLLPALALSDELQHYSGPFQVQLMIPGAPAAAAPSLTVRDQNTNSFVVSAKQPVVGLLRTSQELMAANENADAAAFQAGNLERSVKEAVELGFLRLYEARAAREVARSSQVQLAEQLTVTRARVEAGALTTADVLRLEVARANIAQQELQAGVQESAARIALLTLLDFPLDAEVDFAAPTALEASAEQPAPALADATGAAMESRLDLKQQVRLLDGAESTARARLFALLPEVDLTATYVRIDGQALAQQNAASIGVRASWPVWLWGTQWYAHRAAVHQAEAQRLLSEETGRQVRGEVTGRLDQLRAATAAIDVAQTALTSAEEAYRVTAAVVQAGSGTTTDLLDAQSALTQAKLNLVRSKYQRALAWVQLQRAMGK